MIEYYDVFGVFYDTVFKVFFFTMEILDFQTD